MRQTLLFLLFMLFASKIAHRFNRNPLRLNPCRGLESLAEWRRKPTLMHRNLGCSVETFDALVDWVRAHSNLKSTRYMRLDEKVAIFLFICRFNVSQPVAQTIFARSSWTISNCFTSVLEALLTLYEEIVRQPTSESPVPPFIRNNSKFWPYLKDCVGALDGTHIQTFLAHQQLGDEGVRPWRNRKGLLSQNVLEVSSFDLHFQLVYPGWEGSTHDATVLKAALAKEVFKPPPGRDFLADAGYYNASCMLVPYDGVRHHLKEWLGEGVERPQDKEELFNLRQSSLGNVVERLFGVFKRKFKILSNKNEYSIERQVDLAIVLATVFNSIAQRDRDDPDLDIVLSQLTNAAETAVPGPLNHSIWASRRVRKEMHALRDKIALKMGQDYSEYRSQTR